MSKVKIYSTPRCGYCHSEKEFLKENGIEFEDFNVFSDLKAREEMISKTGQMGVPVTDIDGQIIIGFDRGKIKKLLNIK